MSAFFVLKIFQRFISILLTFSLGLGSSISYAQSAFVSALPEPGTMVMASDAFVPVLVKGLVVHPDKPLNFDFIVDSGNDAADQAVVKEQSQRMAQYFLAAITVPEDQLWVNLSPYEKDRVIENDLGQTVLGRDMLAQDYILKQLTSSLIYPEKSLGKEFWARVYAEAQAKFGTTDIPVDTFNKVWIMPEKAEVFEKGNAVYVTEAKLKVMLDSDRTAMIQNASEAVTDEKAAVAKAVIREIVVPAIEKEVNEGKNFAAIRQVYHAAILAKWYRELIQSTLLADAYVGKNKVSGVTTDEKALKEEIYQRYIAAYKKGVFNYIKEETRANGETLPRKYFSGGERFSRIALTYADNAQTVSRSVGKIFKVDLEMGRPRDAAQSDGRKANVKDALTIEALLREQGVAEPRVDEYFVVIVKHIREINPQVDLHGLYGLYQQILSDDSGAFQGVPGLVTISKSSTSGHDRSGGVNYDRTITDSSFLSFLKTELKIYGVELRETAAGGQIDVDHFVMNPDHYTWQEYHDYYRGPAKYAALLTLCVLAKKKGLPLKKILLGQQEEDYKVMAASEIRLLGKAVPQSGMGNKEKGFLLFERLGLPYPPGIVLSERLVKDLIEMTAAEQKEVMSVVLEILSRAGVDIDRELVSVRSNPKQSMPGILTTRIRVGINIEELLREIMHVAESWYSDRAGQYRKSKSLSDAYDMPIIIQAWRGDKYDYRADTHEIRDGSGVFSTRDPNTNEKELSGRFANGSSGESLMTGGKAGSDITVLAQDAPELYQQLLDARNKLENAVGPQEVEVAVQDRKLYFLQTRDLNFSPQAEIAFIREQVQSGKMSESLSIPVIETLQEKASLRKFYKIRGGVDLKPLATAVGSSPGAFQGYLVFSVKEAQKRIRKGEPFIFVLTDAHRGNVYGLNESLAAEAFTTVFSYPHSALITSYGNGSSHEAVLTRLAGVPALINLKVKKVDTHSYGDYQGIFLDNGKRILEGAQVLIDGDRGIVYEGPSENAIEESVAVFDASYGIDILAMRKEFTSPYLNVDGSIKEEFSEARLEALNQVAVQKYQIAEGGGDKKAAFVANLEKHFLHGLLMMQRKTGVRPDSAQSSIVDLLEEDFIQPNMAQNGGIDIQNIDVAHKSGSAKIQFNDQAIRNVLKNGFNGFTPVIINITPVESPLMILG